MREMTFGVEITGSWDDWQASVRDLPDVAVQKRPADEYQAVREVERQMCAALSYYLRHGMEVPAASPVEPHEWSFTVGLDGANVTVTNVEEPANTFQGTAP